MSECILIGGGSSVNVGRELGLWEKIQGHDLYSINYAFLVMPYLPQHQVWIDTTFFRNNMSRLEQLQKAGVECITKENGKYNAIDTIVQMKVDRSGKKERTGLYIGTMGLSGTFALSIAIHRGYDTIYLLGYDYGTDSLGNTKTHFYQDDNIEFVSQGVKNTRVYLERSGTPKKSVDNYDYFKQFPNKIYNVSPESNIKTFEKIDYQTFFNKLLDTV